MAYTWLLPGVGSFSRVFYLPVGLIEGRLRAAPSEINMAVSTRSWPALKGLHRLPWFYTPYKLKVCRR